MKEKMKKFFTLNKSKNAGFTLVELIVVIAILAILAGVGVPAYSAYVTKANKQADMTLVSEVENAVVLYNYAKNFTAGVGNGTVGYVVLTENGAEAVTTLAGTTENYMADSLVAAFGENWGSVCTLSYNDWTDTATMLSQVANNPYAGSVNGSTYIEGVGTEVLLEDVQGCASDFASFLVGLTNWSGDVGAEKLANQVGTGGSAVTEMLEDYESDEITADVLANATVFGIAAGIDSTAADTIINTGFGNLTNGYVNQAKNLALTTPDLLPTLAHTYAALEALVAYMNVPAATEAFNQLNSGGMVGDASNILGNIKTACADVMTAAKTTENRAKLLAYYNTAGADGKTAAKRDGEAYVAIMQTVDDLSGDYTGSLGNTELFQSEEIANRVNSYVAAASLKDYLTSDPELAAIIAGTTGSAIVLIFAADEVGNLTCTACPASAQS